MKPERIHYWQTCSTKGVKEGFIGNRKTIPEGSLELNNGIKSAGW